MSNHISPQQMVGKTVADVRDGYETLTITFEDGSKHRVNTFRGNPRDI